MFPGGVQSELSFCKYHSAATSNRQQTKDRRPQVQNPFYSAGQYNPSQAFQNICPDEMDSKGLPKDGDLCQSDARLLTYGGTEIKQYVTRDTDGSYKRNQTLVRFYIADANSRAILAYPAHTSWDCWNSTVQWPQYFEIRTTKYWFHSETKNPCILTTRRDSRVRQGNMCAKFIKL